MSLVNTHYYTLYPPRTVSKDLIKSLVAKLEVFKTGLPATSRLLKATAISPEKMSNLQGPECWKVVDSHPLSTLQRIEIDLLLTGTPESHSCELRVEFLEGYIRLSVSDNETGWGAAINEEMIHLLEELGISRRSFDYRVRQAYQLVGILQNVVLTISAVAFSLFLARNDVGYLYASLALFFSGVVPTVNAVFRHFVPLKKVPIVREAIVKRAGFPFIEASSIIGLITGVIGLGKEIYSLLFR